VCLGRAIHRGDKFLPGLRIDSEASPISKQALGSLAAALD
jgi:hypothetical protein